MTDLYEIWLKQHLKDATAEYKKAQKLEDSREDDRELYERVHQMWGYLSGLEKCLRALKSLKASPKAKAAKKSPAKKKK